MGERTLRRTIFLGVLIALVAVAAAYAGLSSYAASRPAFDYAFAEPAASPPAPYPDVRFAVFSDPHYYATSLGTTGAAYEEVLGSDRKLLEHTADLLELAIDDILASNVEFVLVPGDLTKDAETINHEGFAAALARLTEAGVPAYAVPGNHDVDSPDAFAFEGDEKLPVDVVSSDEFAEIYRDFGYGDAILHHEGSLSYVAEPVDGLWLLALDSTRSDEHEPGGAAITAGALTQDQVEWIVGVLQEAQAQGKAVICMMHHGVVEHWEGQAKLHPEYLVEDHAWVGELLASYGVRLVFTGHYHAQDIVRADFGESGFIYDVETGSLATAPCPIRHVEMRPGEVSISSKAFVDDLRPGTAFGQDARDFVFATIESEAFDTARGYWISETDSAYIAARVAPAFVAHYQGDEDPADRPDVDTGEMSFWSRVVWSQLRYVVDGLWVDLPPGDNDVVLDLID